jgi:hypothetical protein
MMAMLDTSWDRRLCGEVAVQCRVKDGCIGMGQPL